MKEIEGQLSVTNKYRFYENAVQAHENDIEFVNDEYKKIYRRRPKTLREDFGGTAALACDWVKQSKNHNAWAIDLDPEPIKYGINNHYAKLSDTEKKRMKYVEGNVLDNYSFKTDIVVAFNFSYFIFKKRNELLSYFKKVKKGLNKDGAFFIDLFGGTDSYEPIEEETEHDNFSYYWDCESFNPITHESLYYIHFKTPDGIKHKKVFTYDWRMWTLMELREILDDAGFSKTLAYWEGDDDDGSGDGNFYTTEEAENCESWVTYLVALP